MASKAVVGTTALAAGLYFANEKYQEHLVQKEKEEAEQRREDMLEDLARRAQEDQMYSEMRGRKNKKGNDEMNKTIKNLEFGRNVHRLVRAYLIRIVEEVKAEAVSKVGRSSKSGLGPGLAHLPLLSTGGNSPDEIALGAALLFGNHEVVQKVLERNIVELRPGIALARLTVESIDIIESVLQRNHDVWQRVEDTELLTGSTKWSLKNLTDDALHIFVQCFALGEMGAIGQTSKTPQILGHFELNAPLSQYDVLTKCAEPFGIFIYPDTCWSGPIDRRKGMEYDWIGADHWLGGLGLERLGLVEEMKIGTRLKDFLAIAGLTDNVKMTLRVTNFPGASFRVPKRWVRIDRVAGTLSYNMDNISPLDPGTRKYFGQKGKATKDPETTSPVEIVAKHLSMSAAGKSLHLLSNINIGTGGIPLEHLAAYAGHDGEILSGIRNFTSDLVSEKRIELFANLSKRLVESIPGPGRDWILYWNTRSVLEEEDCDEAILGYADEVTAARSYARLEREVSLFTKAYMRLIDLSYCLVPFHNGERPSACVPENSVYSSSLETLFVSRIDFPKQRFVRSFILDERRRFLKSRELIAPSFCMIAILAMSISSLCFWLSYEALRRAVSNKWLSNKWLIIALSLVLAATSFSSILGILDGPLEVKHDQDSSMFTRIFTTLKHLAERTQRIDSVRRTGETPFHHEVNRLSKQCTEQYREWVLRCCERDYFSALYRKKIGFSELNGLLMAMAEIDEESGYMEGKIPGSNAQAEAFLDVEIVEDATDDLENLENNSCGSLSAISQSFESSLKRRVAVNMADLLNSSGFEVESSSNSRALIARAMNLKEGVVVAAYKDITLVQFDDGMPTLPIPTDLCSPITRPAEESAESSENEDGCQNDESDTEEVFNEDRARRSLARARRRADRRAGQRRALADNFKKRVKKSKKKRQGEQGADANKSKLGDNFGQEKASDNDFPVDMDDEEGSSTTATAKPKRFRTVRDALKTGGWKLIRMKNHLVYRRKISSATDDSSSHQTFTMSKTPSDWRAERKILSNLRRLDDEALTSADQSEEGVTGQPTKKCLECQSMKSRSEYSKNQWNKNKGKGKCRTCLS